MEEAFPTLYCLGEFDFWLVMDDKRSRLGPEERAALRPLDEALEDALRDTLLVLDGFVFCNVSMDVWQSIYQQFLPDTERQRLGGFYTPMELAEFVLDQAGWVAQREGLCRQTFLNPASGSGAFVVAAVARLLEHLRMDLPCHAGLNATKVPAWNRARDVCRIVTSAAHAVDIHPFATFLTSLNMLFQIIPEFAAARAMNPNFSVEMSVF